MLSYSNNDILASIERHAHFHDIDKIPFQNTMHSIHLNQLISIRLFHIVIHCSFLPHVLPKWLDMKGIGRRGSVLGNVEEKDGFEKKEANSILFSIGCVEIGIEDFAEKGMEI